MQPPLHPRQPLIALLSTALLGLVLWPLQENWDATPTDAFPFSYYPMFSEDRRGRATVTYLEGLDERGQAHFIDYRRAGTGGMNQVRKLIAKRAKKDPNKLCRRVAASVARQTRGPEVRFDSVRIVRSQFVFDRFFRGDPAPRRRQVLCSCPVQRPVSLLSTTNP
jgi:hypothetical protein